MRVADAPAPKTACIIHAAIRSHCGSSASCSGRARSSEVRGTSPFVQQPSRTGCCANACDPLGGTFFFCLKMPGTFRTDLSSSDSRTTAAVLASHASLRRWGLRPDRPVSARLPRSGSWGWSERRARRQRPARQVPALRSCARTAPQSFWAQLQEHPKSFDGEPCGHYTPREPGDPGRERSKWDRRRY